LSSRRGDELEAGEAKASARVTVHVPERSSFPDLPVRRQLGGTSLRRPVG